jgi:quercetin dioxygenase-like cupin family protein
MIRESIISAQALDLAEKPASVYLQTFVSEACGATGFSTGRATFPPASHLPYHTHRFSEAVTLLEGRARVVIEGRAYRLQQNDCVHVPAGIAHLVENEDPVNFMVAHWAFATASPTRELSDQFFPLEDQGFGDPCEKDPETIVRFNNDACYELSENAFFSDLFAHRFGAVGICGGYARFLPGSSLPCHIHDFDESITIVKGTANCLVQGRKYELSGYDTAFVPRGLPHRFLNNSTEEMAMVWVYAGNEPDRRIVEADYCSGALPWPGAVMALKNKV